MERHCQNIVCTQIEHLGPEFFVREPGRDDELRRMRNIDRSLQLPSGKSRSQSTTRTVSDFAFFQASARVRANINFHDMVEESSAKSRESVSERPVARTTFPPLLSNRAQACGCIEPPKSQVSGSRRCTNYRRTGIPTCCERVRPA